IAIQLVLTLVEPQSSGLGGGAFMLYWDAAAHRLTTYDARETAPAAATPQLFLDAANRPLPFYEAVTGGISTGVPGVPRLMELTHRRYGGLPWAQLFAPAIQAADEGFAVSPRLATLLADDRFLRNDPVARGYFFHQDGTPLQAGEVLHNP